MVITRYFPLAALLATIVLALYVNDGVKPARANASGRTTHPAVVICTVFGPRHCLDALEVAWCESRFSTRARNGQYLGLFQMGRRERRNYGHGTGSWAQSRAAHIYFVHSGRDWSPWECQPEGA